MSEIRVYRRRKEQARFDQPTVVTHQITDIMTNKFDGPYASCKKIPVAVLDKWFKNFEKYFKWLPQHHDQIRRNFDREAPMCFRDMLSYARKVGLRPIWKGESVCEELCRQWAVSEYAEIRARNKKNRSSDCGGTGASLHTRGSIPHTKCHRRLALGREPIMPELHAHTQQHLQDHQWVDHKSKPVYEDSMCVSESSQSEPSLGEPLSSQAIPFVSVSSQSSYSVGSGDVALDAILRKQFASMEQHIRKEYKRIRDEYAKEMEDMRQELSRLRQEVAASKQEVINADSHPF